MQSFRPCLKPLVSYLNSKNKTYSYPSSHPQPYWLYLGKTAPGLAGRAHSRLDPFPVLLSARESSHDFRFNSTVILSSEDFKEAWKAKVRCL